MHRIAGPFILKWKWKRCCRLKMMTFMSKYVNQSVMSIPNVRRVSSTEAQYSLVVSCWLDLEWLASRCLGIPGFKRVIEHLWRVSSTISKMPIFTCQCHVHFFACMQKGIVTVLTIGVNYRWQKTISWVKLIIQHFHVSCFINCRLIMNNIAC